MIFLEYTRTHTKRHEKVFDTHIYAYMKRHEKVFDRKITRMVKKYEKVFDTHIYAYMKRHEKVFELCLSTPSSRFFPTLKDPILILPARILIQFDTGGF